MIVKKLLNPHRIRRISGSFAFIEHRFLRDGFWDSLGRDELLLYVFLVMVSDRRGLSYYSYERICSSVGLSPDDYVVAREGLIKKDLIRFDGFMFQVLSLPERPASCSRADPHEQEDLVQCDSAALGRLVDHVFSGKSHR